MKTGCILIDLVEVPDSYLLISCLAFHPYFPLDERYCCNLRQGRLLYVRCVPLRLTKASEPWPQRTNCVSGQTLSRTAQLGLLLAFISLSSKMFPFHLTIACFRNLGPGVDFYRRFMKPLAAELTSHIFDVDKAVIVSYRRRRGIASIEHAADNFLQRVDLLDSSS